MHRLPHGRGSVSTQRSRFRKTVLPNRDREGAGALKLNPNFRPCDVVTEKRGVIYA